MAKAVANLVTWEEAELILGRAYEADRSATYRGRYNLLGSLLTARIEPQAKPGSKPRFTVTVSSTVLTEATLEGIADLSGTVF
jgi:hypothetical protein